MRETLTKQVEQVALENLLLNAYDVFDKNLLSISGRLVLWRSFTDDEQLTRQFLLAKGKVHLLDRRRRLSSAEEQLREEVEVAAGEAFEYLKWARERGGQPIIQESLITYCAAFENCLKTMAVAFHLAADVKSGGLAKQIYVPGPDLTKARHAVNRSWGSNYSPDLPRVQRFFETEIRDRNPDQSPYKFVEPDPQVWSTCGSAFKLRNAILHSMGRPPEQVELGDQVFHAGWDIELSARSLRVVGRAFRSVIGPFDPIHQLL